MTPGAAETAGAHFDARVALAGIGMTNDWKAQDGTEYYAMQAPNDINKNVDNMQLGNWGYGIPATTASADPDTNGVVLEAMRDLIAEVRVR